MLARNGLPRILALSRVALVRRRRSRRRAGMAPWPASAAGGVGARAVAAAAALLLVAGTACTGSGTSPGKGGQRARQDATGAGWLAGVCPDPVVVQTSWAPQVEHAVAYQLLGEGYTVDRNLKKVVGPLVADGFDTGVDIEIRAGGPAIGFSKVSAQMYLNQSIHLGMLATDESVHVSAGQPVLSVMAPFDVDPLVLMWDPQTHPGFHSIVDIGQTDTPVLYFEGEETYIHYLVGSGILRQSQVDPSYNGTPERLITSDGEVVVQGFATSEPWRFEHETRWGKPLKYALVTDTGYPGYRNALFIRASEKDKLAGCLERLVPLFQQAMVDFMDNPGPTTKLVLDLVADYDLSYQDSAERSAYAVKTMREAGIVSNGADQTLGEFDLGRVQQIIDITRPIFSAQEIEVKQGLTAADIATNEFIDPSISLPTE